MHQNRYRPGLWTPLVELTTLPDLLFGWGGEKLPHSWPCRISAIDAFGVSLLAHPIEKSFPRFDPQCSAVGGANQAQGR